MSWQRFEAEAALGQNQKLQAAHCPVNMRPDVIKIYVHLWLTPFLLATNYVDLKHEDIYLTFVIIGFQFNNPLSITFAICLNQISDLREENKVSCSE